MPVVGFLATGDPDTYALELKAFHRGLNEGGFVDGRNVSFDYRWTGADLGLIPALAADLVRRRVSVIAGLNTTAAARAVKTATTTIPSVFCLGGDPVKNGLVSSMDRPGGNLTGVTFLSNELAPKRLGLLRDLVPNAAIIGFLINSTNPNAEADIADMQSAARSVGQQIRIFNAGSERELEPLFSTFARERINALVVGADPYLVLWSNQLIALAASHGLPATYPVRAAVAAGGLMSYSDDRPQSHRQAGRYVSRILKGEEPANLPVLQPTKFEFVFNLKTARALGLTVPPTMLTLADEVIE